MCKGHEVGTWWGPPNRELPGGYLGSYWELWFIWLRAWLLGEKPSSLNTKLFLLSVLVKDTQVVFQTPNASRQTFGAHLRRRKHLYMSQRRKNIRIRTENITGNFTAKSSGSFQCLKLNWAVQEILWRGDWNLTTSDIKAILLHRQIITKGYSVWMINFIPFLCSEITSDINIRNKQKQNHVTVPLR